MLNEEIVYNKITKYTNTIDLRKKEFTCMKSNANGGIK
jgi:hypothetical protein